MDADDEFGIVVAEDFDGVDFDLAGWEFEIGAFASQFVGALAINLDGAELGWGLSDFAHK